MYKEEDMFDESKNYWLHIDPQVYCCIKENHAILYNTRNGYNMETDITEIVYLLMSLYEKENLGAVYFEGILLFERPYREFVIEFCNKKMGYLLDIEQTISKPVQMMPVLNLQHDTDKLNTSENTLRYLIELNIFTHSRCELECPFCKDYFLQRSCCKSVRGQSHELDISILSKIISLIQYGNVGKLNFLGGDIFKYSYYENLPLLLAGFRGNVHIWNHFANFSNSEVIIPNFIYNIVVTFPYMDNVMRSCMHFLKGVKSRYHFYITNVNEYEQTESIIKNYKITNYIIHPIFTQNNYTFFKEYVYTSLIEILETKKSFRQIFARQKLNTNFFGSLTIFPTGDVYANANSTSLGNINNSTLLDIINKELNDNTAWRKIRDTEPCSNCIYQYLCPSPSNYEIVMNKPNLCHIK